MIAELVPVILHLPESEPRSQGVHVSRLIRGIAAETGILKAEWVRIEDLSLVEASQHDWWESLDPSSRLRMSIGLAWEQWYLRQLEGVTPHPGEMQIDGIYMTHDGESLDLIVTPKGRGLYVPVLHEVKATYKSTKTVGNLTTQWMWLAQTKAYCVSPSTRILTHDLKWISAGSVQEGDRLLAFDEHPTLLSKGRKWRVSEVKSVKDVWLNCYELVLDDGTEIICSEDHQWLTLKSESVRSPQWTRVDQLLTSDSPRFGKQDHRICKPLDVWETPSNYQTGWVAGIADGEGWISQSRDGWLSLGMAQKEGAVAEQLRQYLRFSGTAFNEYSRQADKCLRFVIPHHTGVIKFLGQFQPNRLLDKFKGFTSLPEITMGKRAVGIRRRRFIGKQSVRAIETSTGTYIAEGFASHNCKALGTLTAYLHILYLCGDYSFPITPKIQCWKITYTQAEIDDNWELMVSYMQSRMVA